MNLCICLIYMQLIPLILSKNVCNIVKWNPLLNNKITAALILARGGSKSIPLKNLALVNGKSLLGRSLSVVTKVKLFDSVWVSTDNELIAREAKRYHVKIHWRKSDTATDEATSISAVQEFINSHKEIDIVALVQCTSPFIKKEFLQEALNYIYHGKKCAFSVTHSFKLRWIQDKLDIRALNFDPQKRPRRQDWTGELIETGMFYFATRSLIQNGFFQNNKCAVVKIPEKFNYEIDSLWNLQIANKMSEILLIK